MKVLLVPAEGQAVLKAGDFCTAQAGGLLSLYGEPCHEGVEAIQLHGCGRIFLGIDEGGGLCTVGVVAELSEGAVKGRVERAVFVEKALIDLHEDAANPSPQAEGAQGMLAGFKSVVLGDLRQMDQILSKLPVGSVFGVNNTGSGSRLTYRPWGKPVGKSYDETVVEEKR